jgi:hypothetical protein
MHPHTSLAAQVRSFDMSVLGKFGVIMADPPWEIHQVRAYLRRVQRGSMM